MASGQQASFSAGVTGTVAAQCRFSSDDPAVLNIGEMIFTAGANDAVGHLDPTTLTSREATLAGWCNGAAAQISVQAAPLLNVDFTGAPPQGFDRQVDYTATATAEISANPVAVSDSTTSSAASPGATVGVFISDIVVSFAGASTPTGGRLIAGNYSGSVMVTLSPTL
jgi:hypothetical protein